MCIRDSIVVARDGDDVTASGLTSEWRTPGTRWWAWWQTAPKAPDYAAYIYTDRPIYRPGQTVFFKAIVRRDEDAVLSLVDTGTPVTVRIRDARNNVVQTYDLTTNDLGSVNGAFDLAEGAMLGDYAVEVALDGTDGTASSHRQTFKVEDYRKPDYQVTVTPSTTRVTADERVQVAIKSEYFFGEPVPDADVEVNVFQLEERPWWDTREGKYIWYKGYQAAAKGKTDEAGAYTFSWQAQASNYAGYLNWRGSLRRSVWGIEATVNDGSNQTVSGFTVIEVYDAVEMITMDAHGYLHKPGEPFPIDVEVADVIDPDGALVAGRELELTLRRWMNGGYHKIVQSASMTTGEDGRASLDFTVEEPGYYHLRVDGEDRLGNAIGFETYVFAFSDLDARWYGRSSVLDIDADRETYAPGDTAQLLIESTLSGPALLTFERGTTRREQLIELSAPVTMISVPIQTDDAPNIFVTVHAWQAQDTALTEEIYYSLPDSRLYVASTESQVPVTDKTVMLTITPDKQTYAPREVATFTLRTTDTLSRPVSAEVSLALVDEAIFALSEELSGPIHEAFYYARQHIVRTYDALALARYLGYGNGRGGGGGDELAGNPRADFPDTAAWFPALRTDANGELVVAIPLPDSLTRWRLTAKAVTTDTQVGEAHINIVTQQEVIARPILPRVLTAGDTASLSTLLHNYAEVSQTLDVVFSPASLLADPDAVPPTQTVTLPPGGKAVIGWSVAVTGTGEVPVLVQAIAEDRVRDAVQVPLTIQPLAVPEVTTEGGQFQGALTATVTMPTGALAVSTVRLELSRSIAGTLLEGLEFLTGFPYGCVEQTMSKALPNAVVGRAIRQLGVSNPQLQADLPPKVHASLQRLYGYQHNDGGWGWWYDDSTDVYQTAWVVFGLVKTVEAGYEVDAGVIQRGVDWLNDNLATTDIRTRAYALYSMAVAGSPNVTETLALVAQVNESEADTGLDTFSRAGLALALHAAGEDAAAQTVMDVLAETVIRRTGVAYWGGEDYDGHYYQKTMASDTRNTALALSAFVEIQPDSPLIPDVVRWLMGQRKHNGWGSTNETAYTLIALTDHLLATSFSEAAAAMPFAVALNGETYLEGTLGRGEPAISIDIPAARLQPPETSTHGGENVLYVTYGGDGELYYVVSSRVYLAQAAIAADGQVGVTRTYLDPESHEPLTQVVPGALVEVQLEVTMPGDATYIIVEDHLPGGLEALNERLNTTSHVEMSYGELHYYWQDYGYNHKEVRGDRVSFFVTEFPVGKRTFTYFARATHAGTFTALPAEVSAMYDLTVWGRSESQVFVVEAEP